MSRYLYLLLLVSCFLVSPLQAKPFTVQQVPEPLKPWISWVVQDNPERACPFLYNSYEQKRCSWPSGLALTLNANKGEFSISWQVYKESWVALPGDNKHWPLNVSANNKPALVLEQNGVPSIKLATGFYQIKGEFLWDTIPDNLTIPVDTGLISLQINGTLVNSPIIKDSQLWLKESDKGQVKPQNVQNHLDVQIFRKIIDDVPMQVITRLELEYSGEQREVKLEQSLLDGFIPMQLQSPLPARLDPDGQLVVQVRPGYWQIEIRSHSSKEINALSLPKDLEHSEIWVFEARPELRVIEVEQLNTIDSSQTNLSDDWKSLPAYKVNSGQTMGFKLIRRGNPDPEPNQLELSRKLWLDFDGSGYTVNDSITGKMTRGWRLNTLPQTLLGKLTLDGNSQLITREVGTKKEGVEVRKGIIMLNADSRLVGKIDNVSAVGWEQTFHQVRAELNLPPGWSILAASGVDNVPDSWISRWTLLDLFIVLITALAIGRLWNHYWGILALITLVIIWHEQGAPHYIWLNILAATALLRVLPQSRFSKFILWYQYASWLVLVLITLPFMVSQVRIGIYPQLEKPWQDIHAVETDSFFHTSYFSESAPATPAMVMRGVTSPGRSLNKMEQNMKAKRYYNAPAPEQKKDNALYESAEDSAAVDFERTDPKAKVQTGPGLPQWQWNKVALSWNGAVDAGQRLCLWYISPGINLILNFLRVILVSILALLMFGVAEKFKPDYLEKLKPASWTMPLLVWFLLLPLIMLPAKSVYADDFPDERLLNELKTRLQEFEMPDCLPQCATIPEMKLVINDKELLVSLEINAAESVVLPLPSEYGQWFPSTVLDNGKSAEALYRNGNTLWINLKQGQHQLVLRGVTPLLSKFTLPLPLKPKRVTVENTAWELVGLQENGLADEQLQFIRTQLKEDKSKPAFEQGTLPAFISVERTLQLGLDWKVITRITRLSPADSAVVLTIPLLKGEAVTTAGVRVKDNAVIVNMAAQQTSMQWQSLLAKSEQIELLAPVTDQWIEVWKADVSPIWHTETNGIAMISLNVEGRWLPEWHPWPGEKVIFTITRPEAVVGKTLTIDGSTLKVTQGQRSREVELRASLRSSQGMQHTLTLPENAVLQSVAINGQARPLRLEARKLTLPLNPGNQDIAVTWQEATAIAPKTSTSSIDLGEDSVNTNLTINLGQDRWVLFATGPKFGPIILFWGELIVIIIVSLGLGKISLTPLKNWQWFLLLLGLSQVPMESAGFVIAWLIALGWRLNYTSDKVSDFNCIQVCIGILTFISLSVLLVAVAEGLLSAPDMHITGNYSTPYVLNWYQDRSQAVLPVGSVISLPIMVYRLLMLAWSLWLAVSLLDWLKWGWGCFASNGLWKKPEPKINVVDVEAEKTDVWTQ